LKGQYVQRLRATLRQHSFDITEHGDILILKIKTSIEREKPISEVQVFIDVNEKRFDSRVKQKMKRFFKGEW